MVVNKDSLMTGKYYQDFGVGIYTIAKANLVQLGCYSNENQLFYSYDKEFSADTRIKFAQITTYRMRGIFSGTVYIDISTCSEKLILTNGEFYIQRVK